MKVEIKDKIAEKLQKRIDESDEFKNIEEYIDYILKQVVEKLEGKPESEKKETFGLHLLC